VRLALPWCAPAALLASPQGLALRRGIASAAGVALSTVKLVAAVCTSGVVPPSGGYDFSSSMIAEFDFFSVIPFEIAADAGVVVSAPWLASPDGATGATPALRATAFLVGQAVYKAMGCSGASYLNDFVQSFASASGAVPGAAFDCGAGAITVSAAGGQAGGLAGAVAGAAASASLSAGAAAGITIAAFVVVAVAAAVFFFARRRRAKAAKRLAAAAASPPPPPAATDCDDGGLAAAAAAARAPPPPPRAQPPIGAQTFGGANPLFAAARRGRGEYRM
jgi:hypothetical protein